MCHHFGPGRGVGALSGYGVGVGRAEKASGAVGGSAGLGPGGFAAGRLVELALQLVELVMVFRAMLVLGSVTYNSLMPDLYGIQIQDVIWEKSMIFTN